ncbi:CLUMA_CG000116, isoform A [Clunio marinus]|uniref:CLUMA_CG000116, isoform A n=1 Tax=Clunio marinus TaxID=568069 RepID=A0A1J1HFS2_9DIPT|nr:CLUMA_CG000116, isoform A [Clunio marinus]
MKKNENKYKYLMKNRQFFFVFSAH